VTRLLHVTTSDMSLELLLGPQLRAFRDAGYEVHTASAPGPYVEGLVAEGIVHHPLRHATRSTAPHRDVAALVELHRLFRRLRPDIVHTHNPKPGVYGRIAARTARVPLVVNTQHGLYAQPGDRWRRRAPIYALERIAAACSDIELVQNPEDIEALARLGVPRGKLWFLGNGIDLDRFQPRPEVRREVRTELGFTDADIVVGAVGRLVHEKGYADLFEAARLLAPNHPELRWLVVGPTDTEKGDPLTEADIAAAQDAGVRFLGRRDDPERLYQAMDIYVLASHREGWPRSAMEAAACGLPAVATDIRGCRQVIEDGVTGVLVPVRSPDSMADAIGRLAEQPDRRRGLAATAASRARKRFGQDRVVAVSRHAYGHSEPARRADT
jgi:glycosyltransferase involved in cell wall biosynthesis